MKLPTLVKTGGGNGGWTKRKALDMGLNKPLKTSQAGTVAGSGKFEKKKP